MSVFISALGVWQVKSKCQNCWNLSFAFRLPYTGRLRRVSFVRFAYIWPVKYPVPGESCSFSAPKASFFIGNFGNFVGLALRHVADAGSNSARKDTQRMNSDSQSTELWELCPFKHFSSCWASRCATSCWVPSLVMSACSRSRRMTSVNMASRRQWRIRTRVMGAILV